MNQYSESFKVNLIKLCDNLCIILERDINKTKRMEFIKYCIKSTDIIPIMLYFLSEFKSFFENIITMKEDIFVDKLCLILNDYIPENIIKDFFFNNFSKKEKLLVWNYIFKLYDLGLKHILTNEIFSVYSREELDYYIGKIDLSLKEIDILFGG